MAFNLKSAKSIMSGIAAVSKSKLKNDVHELAVHVTGHALLHGDTTPAKSLVLACHDARLDIAAVVRWLAEFGPFVPQFDGEGKDRQFVGFKLGKEKVKSMVFDGEAMLALTPWYEWKKETPAQVLKEFDVLAKVQAIIKSAMSKAQEGATIQHAEMLDELNKLATKVALSAKRPVTIVPTKDGDPIPAPAGAAPAPTLAAVKAA